LNIEKLDLVAS